MLAALPPMMKPIPSSSIQIREKASDIIGSSARKRRREILQSNRATKTSSTGAHHISTTPIGTIKKKSRASSTRTTTLPPSGNAPTDSPAHLHCAANNSKTPHNCSSLLEKETVKIPTFEKTEATVIAQPAEVEDTQHSIFDDALDTAGTLSSCGKKKPQMRYDPSVPMTKEAAAVWRREQRRKRNRDSAAASRQRQRNRISELEDEVAEWKIKFDEAMERLAKQESKLTQLTQLQDSQPRQTSGLVPEIMPEFVPNTPIIENALISRDDAKSDTVFQVDRYSAVSPCPYPQSTPNLSNTVSSDMLPLLSSQALPVVGDVVESEVHSCIKIEEQDQQYFMSESIVAKEEKNLFEISRPVQSESSPSELCVQ